MAKQLKCVKGQNWVDENDWQKNASDRKCINCVYQFACGESDFQPIRKKTNK